MRLEADSNVKPAVRRTESVEKAEAILLQARAIHPKVAMIAFNLACYAMPGGRESQRLASAKFQRVSRKLNPAARLYSSTLSQRAEPVRVAR
jgi:hypothetical protein